MHKEDMHKWACQTTQGAGSAELKCFVQGLFGLVEILLFHFVLSLLG